MIMISCHHGGAIKPSDPTWGVAMGNSTKLTVRLPIVLHQRLRRRALEQQRSLNQVIVDAVAHGIEPVPAPDEAREVERVLRVIRESGLLDPPAAAWERRAGQEEPATDLTISAFRAYIGPLTPPLSETIVEERGPR